MRNIVRKEHLNSGISELLPDDERMSPEEWVEVEDVRESRQLTLSLSVCLLDQSVGSPSVVLQQPVRHRTLERVSEKSTNFEKEKLSWKECGV